MELWYRLAPATGPNTVAVTFSAAANGVAGATSWTGVEQIALTGFVSANVQSTTPTANVSSAAGDVVVDAVVNIDATAPSAGAGQTQRWSAKQGDSGGGGSHEPGAIPLKPS